MGSYDHDTLYMCKVVKNNKVGANSFEHFFNGVGIYRANMQFNSFTPFMTLQDGNLTLLSI